MPRFLGIGRDKPELKGVEIKTRHTVYLEG